MPMLARVLWFAVVACALSFAAQSFFGNVLASETDAALRSVTIKDVYTDESHELSGMVMVPSACHDLTVRTKDMDGDTVALIFESWEQPYRNCAQELTPRAFRIVVFAPEQVKFRAILDNDWVAVRLLASR